MDTPGWGGKGCGDRYCNTWKLTMNNIKTTIIKISFKHWEELITIKEIKSVKYISSIYIIRGRSQFSKWDIFLGVLLKNKITGMDCKKNSKGNYVR